MYNIKPFENTLIGRDLFNDLFNKAFDKENIVMPVTNVRENENEYIVESEMPGINKEDIKVNYKDKTLSIEVSHEENNEVKDENENYIRRERRSQNYKRQFYVENIVKDEIKAKYENGVLTINLPKEKIEEKTDDKYIEIM